MCIDKTYTFAPLQEIWASIATSNLHILCCQLALQELLLGDTAVQYELWVERLIQSAKQAVKFHTVEYPEVVIAVKEMTRQGLDVAKYSRPVILQTSEEMWNARPQKALSAAPNPAYDVLRNNETQTSMLDKGKRIDLDQLPDLKAALIKHVRSNPVMVHGVRMRDKEHLRGINTPDQVTELEAFEHRLVKVQGQLCMTSVEYTRQKKSQSYWVLFTFTGLDKNTYVQPGRVDRYIRVSLPPHPDDGSPRFLRVAVSDFWGRLAPWGDDDTGGPVHRLFFKQPSQKNYICSLDSVVSLLNHTSNQVPTPGVEGGRKMMLFVGYDHTTGLKA